MRIERLDIRAFGRLADFDTGEAPLPSLVVVLGPNEAGKSTVFEFLTTLLYGFLPASRNLNPLVPWGGGEARGSLMLRLHDGRMAEVTRRLRSQPAGQLVLADRTTDLRNQPVPWVEHVPRRVFRQVFAVTLGELASLDEETWARIQDRVIGSMGAADLRPVREVATELEREAGELWRPNRRGNQRVRDTRERMRALRARRRDAGERDRELRAKVDELEQTRRTLQARRDRRARDEAEVERARLLAPVRAQMIRIAALREEGGPLESLADLPPRPHDRLRDLEAMEGGLRERLEAIEAERGPPVDALAERDQAVRAVLEGRDEIIRYGSSASRAAADRDRVVELRAELHGVEESLDRVSRDLLGVPWSDAERGAVLALAPGTARDAVERMERAGRADPRPSGPTIGSPPPAPGSRVGAGLLILLGTALVALGVGTGSVSWSALGAALATAGSALLWVGMRARRAHSLEAVEREREAHRRASELNEAKARFDAVMQNVPLAPRHTGEPGNALVAAVGRLHELDDLHRARSRAQTDATDRLDTARREGLALARRLGLTCQPDDRPEDIAFLLSNHLRRAERVDQAAAATAREVERLDRAKSEAATELEQVGARVGALRKAATRFGDGPPADALACAAKRMEAHERARGLLEELERSHADLPALRMRVEEAERAGASWIKDEGDLALRHARIQELTAEIEDLTGRTKALAADIAHAGKGETADWVDGEIATLEAETAELVLERDRKWLLARLLREADRRFREEHQPDLMRRASGYLAHLTGGRYDRILAEESDESELFRIAGPGLAGPIPLKHPVSTGTLEQAYLSLRLAIVDHLDHGPEPLPLFIDEVFVNWDAERRSRGLEAVARIAETRQVFLFTCHPSLARELQESGAHLIRLERQ